jgi:hypothetical protein
MKSVFNEIEIIKFFESWISNLEKSQDGELLLNYIQEFFKVIESDLSEETKKYLDKIIKDSLKKYFPHI